MSTFDAVCRFEQDGTLVQGIHDLHKIKQDCDAFKTCLKKYQIKNNDIVDLSDNPSSKEVSEKIAALYTKLKVGKKKDPFKRYFIMFLFAGHGVLIDGMQNVLYNEYDKVKKYYKVFAAEKKLRSWAEVFPNSYIVSIFACCRQTYNPKKMSDFFDSKSLNRGEVLSQKLNDLKIQLANLHD